MVGETAKVSTTPGIKEGELDLFVKTADGGFKTRKQSMRGKWNLNFHDDKVKTQASENYFTDKRNSFKVNPLRNLNKLLDSETKRAPVFSRKKHSLQLAYRPDSDELMNIEISKNHLSSRQAARSLLQKTFNSSTATKDTTTYSIHQMKSGHEKQSNSLSPPRSNANPSTLFGGPSKRTEASVGLTFLQ